MEKFLKPERLDIEPDQKSAEQQWNHWLMTFKNFMTALCADNRSPDKLSILINYVSPRVYGYIADCSTYDTAIQVLQTYYIKPTNVIYARHLLSTRKQGLSESLDQYLIALKQLSQDCKFIAVSAALNRDEAIRDAMITGLQSSYIRQRLLENKSLTLSEAYDQARALESAHLQAETYRSGYTSEVTAAAVTSFRPDSTCITDTFPHSVNSDSQNVMASTIKGKHFPVTAAKSGAHCYFCGFTKHPRSNCPARHATCHNCSRRGHFAKVCQSADSMATSLSATIMASAPDSLKGALLSVIINGVSTKALIDTGSSESLVSSA